MKKTLSVLLAAVLTVSMAFTPITVSAAAVSEEKGLEAKSNITQDVTVEGTNGAGTLIAQEITAKESELKNNNGCNVFTVEMDGKTASVSFETTKDCTLLVAIYDESGKQMVASGKKEVKKGDAEATVTIDISSMPTYFYLRAFLIGTNNLEPLCTAYESPNYTKKMVQFFSKTVDDFDSGQVVNFDNDKKNNFAVYDKGTKIVEPSDGKNIVTKADDANKQYVIKKIDQQISSLKAGDVFAYEYETGELLIVKIKSIKLSGTTATIEGSETTLTEVFDYVKVDTESGIEDAEVVQKTKEDGLIDNGLVSFNEQDYGDSSMKAQASAEGKATKAISKKVEKELYSDSHAKIKISGELNFKLDAVVRVYVVQAYQYVELRFDASIGAILTASGSANWNFYLDAFKYTPVPCVEIAVTPKMTFQFSGKIQFTGLVKATVGGSYDSNSGYKTLTGNPTVTSALKAESKIYVGVGLTPAVNVVHENVLSIFLDGEVGLEVVAVSDLYNSSSSSTEKHTCKICIDGDVNFKAKVTFGVKFLKESVVDQSLFNESYHLADFYYSASHNEFGWGNCPYKNYKVTVTVKNTAGNPVEGATIENNQKTDKSGQAVLWLGNGTYILAAAKDGYLDTKGTVTVYDKPAELQITMNEESESGNKVTVTVVDEEGKPIAGATVNGIITDASGKAVLTMENGTQTITVKKDGYEDVVQNVTVKDEGKAVTVTMTKNGGTSGGEIINGEKVKNIVVGFGHSAAITERGDLYMWGRNKDGELGIGNTKDSCVPVKVMSNVKSVDVGEGFSAAVTESGELYTWGSNDLGRLADGTTKSRTTPQKIMSNVKSVSLGDNSGGVITNNGDLYTWNCTRYLPEGGSPKKILSNVKDVSIGFIHFAAVKENGDLYTWGSNDNGRLGNGSSQTEWQYDPQKIMSNVKQVSLGYNASAAITLNGDLYVWGGAYLGDGTCNDRNSPVKIMGQVTSVCLGGRNGTAVKTDGSMYIWGMILRETEGITAEGTFGTVLRVDYKYSPEKVMDNIRSVSIGTNYNIAAVKDDGTLYLWWNNMFGELGDGTTTDRPTPTQITIPSSSMAAASIDAEEETPSVQTAATNNKSVVAAMASSDDSNDKVSVTTSVKTATYNKLRTNTTYNFYVMKDRDAEDPLSSSNLLYVGQAVSDGKGNLSIDYGCKVSYTGADSFVVGTSVYDLYYAKVTINYSSYTYTGKAIKPTVKVVAGGKTLKKGTDYTVTYSDNTKIGQATIKVKGIGKYEGQKTITFKIIPKKVTISSAKSLAKKSITVRWKKVSNATGYQVQWSKSKKFTSVKSTKVKGTSKISKKITKLSAKKKYYVRVRTYKVVNGKTYYGKWSAIKSATTK